MFSIVSGCGGGGETSDGVVAAKTVSWVPPTAFSDGTPLNPMTDLDDYEIFVKETDSFSNSDTPTAIVAAVLPGTNQAATSFNLANLGPFLKSGATYYVSMRAVGLDGLKSNFSAPASFSL